MSFVRFPILVSILVLLEIGLGDGHENLKELNYLCFNPCFVGNRSGSQITIIIGFGGLVSILVLLEIGLGGPLCGV